MALRYVPKGVAANLYFGSPHIGDSLWSIPEDAPDPFNGFPSEEEWLYAVSRDLRNGMLMRCDYVMVSDYPVSEEQRAEWVEYRQALRDLTQHPDFPMCDFPLAPNVVLPEV